MVLAFGGYIFREGGIGLISVVFSGDKGRSLSINGLSSCALPVSWMVVDELVAEFVKGMSSFWALWLIRAAFFDHLRVHSKVLCHGCSKISCVFVVFFGKTLNS